MEDTICRHVEVIDSSTHIGTYKLCGQQLQYDDDERRITRLLKRGTLNGQLTMIRPPIVEHKEKKVQPKKPAAPSFLSKERTQLAPRKKKARNRYYEKFKEEMLKDYAEMRLIDFLKKWHISSGTWLRLKKLWKVEPKVYRSREKKKDPSTPARTLEKTQANPGQKFQTGPLNKRTGSRAIWRF